MQANARENIEGHRSKNLPHDDSGQVHVIEHIGAENFHLYGP